MLPSMALAGSREDTAGVTHAPSCGALDRGSNEVRYLQEPLEMIEEFQRRGAEPGYDRKHVGGTTGVINAGMKNEK